MKMIEELDFTEFTTIVVTYLLLFLIIFVRYIAFSGSYYFLLFKVLRGRLSERILVEDRPRPKQVKRELQLSVYSALIFALMALGIIILWQKGWTGIYNDPYAFPLWYIPLSVLAFLFIQDTYYYWLHRWMHSSGKIRGFHLEHHRSVETTVFTSFSFHPVESVLQATIIPIIFLFLPMHITAVLTVLLIMTFSSVINHAGVEVYSNSPAIRNVKKFIIGATHHDVHHKNAKKNFGLYFTFWDRLMKTEISAIG
ncbi:MAG: sterol desaturase family protein [Pricia sp.]